MNNSFNTKKTNKLKSFLLFLFGTVKWNSPPWINFFRLQAKNRPIIFYSLLSLIMITALTASVAYYWYSNLPQPQLITTVITPPGITPLAEELIPEAVIFDFGYKGEELQPQSVAPFAFY